MVDATHHHIIIDTLAMKKKVHVIIVEQNNINKGFYIGKEKRITCFPRDRMTISCRARGGICGPLSGPNIIGPLGPILLGQEAHSPSWNKTTSPHLRAAITPSSSPLLRAPVPLQKATLSFREKTRCAYRIPFKHDIMVRFTLLLVKFQVFF